MLPGANLFNSPPLSLRIISVGMGRQGALLYFFLPPQQRWAARRTIRAWYVLVYYVEREGKMTPREKRGSTISPLFLSLMVDGMPEEFLHLFRHFETKP